MLVIVFAIKSFFFSIADSYSFGQKPHTSHFFLLFYREMIKVVCTMLVITIEDLKMLLDNSNLLLGKSVIWFEPSALKKETGKQTTSTLYY